jgi:hypothetical protein
MVVFLSDSSLVPIAYPRSFYSPECVEGEFSELRHDGVLRSAHEPLDSLTLSSEAPAVVGLFGARRLSQQPLSFPSPETTPTRTYEGSAQVDYFGTLRQARSTVTTWHLWDTHVVVED